MERTLAWRSQFGMAEEPAEDRSPKGIKQASLFESQMAKKRKKDKDAKEEYEFRPPDFDEKEFLRKELSDTKTMIWTVAYACAFGLAAGVLMLANSDLLGVAFVIGIGGVVSLRYFYPIIKVDTKAFQKKNWLGNSATFFFTFLAIWVLVLNVPFTDHAKPGVENVIVWVDDGVDIRGIEYKFVSTLGVYSWVPLNSTDVLGEMISTSAVQTLNLTAKVTDNGNLESVVIQVTTVSGQVTAPMVGEGNFRFGHPMYSSELDPAVGLRFTITATDEAGNIYTWPSAAVAAIPISA
jgi:hypothetical protein